MKDEDKELFHNRRIAELRAAFFANLEYVTQAEIEEEISAYSIENGLPSMSTCSPERKKSLYWMDKQWERIIV